MERTSTSTSRSSYSPSSVRTLGLGGEIVLFAQLVQGHTLVAFHQHLDGAVREFEQLQDGGQRAEIEQVAHLGLIDVSLLLGHQRNLLAHLHGRVERQNGLLATDKQRDDHMRIDHHVAQRQNRHTVTAGLSGHFLFKTGFFGHDMRLPVMPRFAPDAGRLRALHTRRYCRDMRPDRTAFKGRTPAGDRIRTQNPPAVVFPRQRQIDSPHRIRR